MEAVFLAESASDQREHHGKHDQGADDVPDRGRPVNLLLGLLFVDAFATGHILLPPGKIRSTFLF